MIGNDLVDLRAREASGKSGDARFVARVFTARETELIARSSNPDAALWALWAAKEAAYKVAKKLRPDVIFAHSRYEVIPDGAERASGDDGRSELVGCAPGDSTLEGSAPGGSVEGGAVLRSGRVISKEQFVEHLCGFDEDVTANAIEVYVHRLRRKLDPVGIHVQTVRGLGYFVAKAAA